MNYFLLAFQTSTVFHQGFVAGLSNRRTRGDFSHALGERIEIEYELSSRRRLADAPAILQVYRHLRAKQCVSVRRHDLDAMHEVEDLFRIFLAYAVLHAFQEWKRPPDDAPSRIILRAIRPRIAASRRERGTWVFGFQPIDDRLNPFDIFVSNVMFGTKSSRYIHMGDIETREE